MKLFDGVEIKPALTPTMQGVISWALVLANTVIEADRSFNERLVRETGTGRPLTLNDVMEQSGLRIPGLAAAVEQLMGGTEEAKQVASLIVDNPDPAVLVQKFAERLGVQIVAQPAPAATATPPTSPPSAPPSSTGSPDRVHEARSAPVSESPAALPAFRADFTREAREASKATASLPAPSVNPPTPTPTAESAVVRPSLVGLLEHQLGALRRRMTARQVELDVHLKRMEAEIAKLRRELDALRVAEHARTLAPTPPASPGSNPTTDATVAGDQSTVVTEDSAGSADQPPPGDRPAVDTAENAAPETAPVVGYQPPERVSEGAAELDADLHLPAAPESEAVHAARLIADLAEEAEDYHQQDVARIVAVARELSVTQALVERERDAGGGAPHG